MRYLILVLLLTTLKLHSIEAINYLNESAMVYAMYDTEEYDLLLSNSIGCYSVNKDDSHFKPIKTINGEIIFNIDHFFEFDNTIYCYREQGVLYKINDGIADSIAVSVVAHYVKDNKLYLLRSREPRVQVIEDDISTLFSTGDEDGIHFYADIVEVNNEVYAYLGLTWTGNRMIFRITDNGLDYLMSKFHLNYETFQSLKPNKMYSINNELWIRTSKGLYKYDGNDFVPISSDYAFNFQYVYECYYENGFLYGINTMGIFKYDFESKETIYLLNESKEIGFNHLYVGKKKIYFQIDQDIFLYNPDTSELTEFQQYGDSRLVSFIESVDEELIIARENQIEWYKTFPPEIISMETVYANEFYDIAYDSYNDRIVAIGLSDKYYFVQYYDGFSWEVITLSVEDVAPGNIIKPDVNILPDKNGNYYVSIYDYFGVWDGNEWERISFLNNPNNVEHRPKQEYHILCLDSLGGIWVSAFLDEYSSEENDYVSTNAIYRITENGAELIDKDLKPNHTGLFRDGIYLSNGDVVINSSSDEIYYYNSSKGEGRLLISEDGYDHPLENDFRSLYQNKNGDLVICYSIQKGWHKDYGSYELPGGISVFDGENWDHEKYKAILEETNMECVFLNLFIDENGNECLINHEQLIVILNDNEYLSYPITGLSLMFSKLLYIKNEIWFNHWQQGLFRIPLPIYNSVKDEAASQNLLTNEIITDDVLELNNIVCNYQIYSLSGQRVLSGSNSNKISINDLCNGVYFIVCQIDSMFLSKKFIVRR